MIKTTVKVEGLMCGNCERHVNEAVEKAFDIKKVTSSHDTGETIILSKEALDAEKLAASITDAGYTVTSVTSQVKKGLFGFGK